MRIRRHDPLLCRWVADSLEIALPARKGWMRLSEDLRRLLQAVGDGTEAESLAATFEGGGERDHVGQAITSLLRLGVLEDQDDQPQRSETWQRWGQAAQRFHVESRDAYVPFGSDDQVRAAQLIIEEGAAPPGYKEYDSAPI